MLSANLRRLPLGGFESPPNQANRATTRGQARTMLPRIGFRVAYVRVPSVTTPRAGRAQRKAFDAERGCQGCANLQRGAICCGEIAGG